MIKDGEVIYYEAHITIDPAGDRHDEFKAICLPHTFRAADLLMRKSLEPSVIDSFCTARNQLQAVLMRKMWECMRGLTAAGFKVRRYKIEAALLDVRLSGKHLALEPEGDIQGGPINTGGCV